MNSIGLDISSQNGLRRSSGRRLATWLRAISNSFRQRWDKLSRQLSGKRIHRRTRRWVVGNPVSAWECLLPKCERMEQRVMPTVVWGATDGIFSWQDADGDTQALDVLFGDIEIQFQDNVNNTGNITQIRFLTSQSQFDITTTDIDWINAVGTDIGTLNIGVDVGSELADTVGTVDLIQARDVRGPMTINGNLGTLNLTNHLRAALTINGNLTTFNVDDIKAAVNVSGNVGTFTVNEDVEAAVAITGDVGTFTVIDDVAASITVAGNVGTFTSDGDINNPISIGGDLNSFNSTDGSFNSTLTVERAVGAFNLNDTDNGLNFADNYATATQVTYNGVAVASNTIPIANNDTFSLNENATNSTSVGTVSVTDPDTGETITFSILSGNVGGVFTINNNTGEITVADNSTLDFETRTSYTLTIQVTDSGGLTDTATITVNVNDINENPPNNQNNNNTPTGKNSNNPGFVSDPPSPDTPDGPEIPDVPNVSTNGNDTSNRITDNSSDSDDSRSSRDDSETGDDSEKTGNESNADGNSAEASDGVEVQPAVEAGNAQVNQAEARNLQRVAQASGGWNARFQSEFQKQLSRNSSFSQHLEQMADEINSLDDITLPKVAIGSSVLVTAGFAMYDLRKLYFLLSAMSSVSQWKQFDLLTVLSGFNRKDDRAETEASNPLVSMVGQKTATGGELS